MFSRLIISVFFSIYLFFSLSLVDGGLTQFDTCVRGDIFEGPSCTTFSRCVVGRIVNRKVTFNCPPGTSFNTKQKLCNYISSDCASQVESLQKLSLRPPPLVGAFKPVAPVGVPGGDGTGPPGIPPPEIAGPPGPGPACSVYELDPDSIYDCRTPGLFPSNGECSKFYRCVNTMGCIVKGFYVACPTNYLFDTSRKTCLHKSLIGKCPFLLDDSQQEIIQPVIQLDESNVQDFFLNNAYWRLMRYIPNEKQRIIRVPAQHSRNSIGAEFNMKIIKA